MSTFFSKTLFLDQSFSIWCKIWRRVFKYKNLNVFRKEVTSKSKGKSSSSKKPAASTSQSTHVPRTSGAGVKSKEFISSDESSSGGSDREEKAKKKGKKESTAREEKESEEEEEVNEFLERMWSQISFWWPQNTEVILCVLVLKWLRYMWTRHPATRMIFSVLQFFENFSVKWSFSKFYTSRIFNFSQKLKFSTKSVLRKC